MSQTLRGLAAMVLACTIWGLSPLYYKLLADVPPVEVLAHRTLWSLVTFAGILAVQGRLAGLAGCLDSPVKRRATLGAAVVISLNWFGFIYAVSVGRALEASLGYYIFPLVSVALGVAVFGDRLSRWQGVAVALAAAAVAVLTAGLAVVPALSLMLAVTFATYGVFKRRVAGGAMASVAAELALLSPLALVWLAGVHGAGWTDMTGRQGGAFLHDPGVSLLLIVSGPLTGLPLILFSYASQRVRLSTLGLVQYLNPTLQFLCAAVIFGETVTLWHAIAFPMIWAALALYSADSLSRQRRPAAPGVDKVDPA